MENSIDIPVCPPPWDAPNDTLPMLVVLGCFLLGGWLLRLWRKRRRERRKTPQENVNTTDTPA